METLKITQLLLIIVKYMGLHHYQLSSNISMIISEITNMLFCTLLTYRNGQKREQKLKNANNTKPYKTNKPLQNNGLKVLEVK